MIIYILLWLYYIDRLYIYTIRIIVIISLIINTHEQFLSESILSQVEKVMWKVLAQGRIRASVHARFVIEVETARCFFPFADDFPMISTNAKLVVWAGNSGDCRKFWEIIPSRVSSQALRDLHHLFAFDVWHCWCLTTWDTLQKVSCTC